jgi:SAM-dependent methyltransferase
MSADTGFKTHYFKQLAELEANNFWFRGRNRIILWALQKYCPKLRSFLEIGCGTGFVTNGISKKFPEAELTGSEYLGEGLIYARQRVPSADFQQLDARFLPFESRFEAIGAFDVLEHIDKDETVLQQVHKALKPGGYAFITVPQHQWLWSAVDEDACHLRRYSVSDLHKKIGAAGFTIVRSTSFVSTLLPAMYLSRLFQRQKPDRAGDAMAELRINPILNRIFEWFMYFELGCIQLGVSFPFGGSRMVVAQKANRD